MENLFLTVLNLSVAGCYAVLAVLLARLLLAKAPKKWRYALWAVVAFRLAVPVSFASRFSLLNLTTAKTAGGRVEYIPANIGYQAAPTVELGSPALNQAVNGSLPAATPFASMNPIQFFLYLGQWLWLAGIAAILLYNVASLLWLRRSLKETTHIRENIWRGAAVAEPFVLGWLRPRIYLPEGMEPAAEEIVLAHERYHIRRGDHWVKLLGFCLLTLHWFNPFCWLAFRLMTRDMEMSCDEGVLAKQPVSPKAYSNTLLGLAVGGARPLPGALHFGESDIGSRIKNSLRWKKPARWVTCGTAALAAAVILCVAANPVAKAAQPQSVTLTLGHYRMENDSDVIIPPVLTLEENGRFIYPYSAFLSSFPEGSYRLEGDLLTCVTDDERYTLRFKVADENTLVYLADGSTHPGPLSKPIDATVEDGARFVRFEFPEQPEKPAEMPAEPEPQEPVPMGKPLEDYDHISLYANAEHRGTDFAAPAGTPVYAVADGAVLISQYHYSYGNHVVLAHEQLYDGQEVRTLYAHMSELAVEENQTVKQGDLLGYVGATGTATGNCLHLEMRIGNERVEPTEYVTLRRPAEFQPAEENEQ